MTFPCLPNRKPVLRIVTGMVLFFILFHSCNTPTSDLRPEESFPLKEYVQSKDASFKYEVVETISGESWTEYVVRMTSGEWLSASEVDPVTWWHWINIVIPDEVREPESMMIIGGGASDDRDPRMNNTRIRAAVATGSIISRVTNVPFQPVRFKGDSLEHRYEDALIAFGWRKFLESGAAASEQEWLARFPMTRAVVRAMDVVELIAKEAGKPVDGFFVTGASKRGWTTWTTAAVDDRVIGIAPIVIDLLNIVPSFQHHWQCLGEWSPAVQEYVDDGIMDWMLSSEFEEMLNLVEPYSFIDRLDMPKLVINGTCDEFFVTDSWQFYWDDLLGEKHLLYVPNGNHGLRGTYQPSSLFAYYNSVITDTPVPEYSWSVDGNIVRLSVDQDADYRINKWEAVNPKARDFRIYVVGEAWQKEEIPVSEDGTYVVEFEEPESGYKAGLVEIVFNPDTDFALYLTSGTLITPDTYPFDPFETDMPLGTTR